MIKNKGLFRVVATRLMAFALVSACLGLTACATLISSQYQSLTFSSQPQGATVTIDGTSYGKTPLTVVVKRSMNGAAVQYSLDGYQTKAVIAPTRFNYVSLLDILFWPSFFVDLATGAIVQYDPPLNQVTLDSNQATGPGPATH